MVFVACQTIESRSGVRIPEIWNELREYERKPYAQRVVGRGIDKLRPTDAAAARHALYAIIDRATAQIALRAKAHRVRAKLSDSLAADRLAFDDSPEAERLRRFDLACGRGLARSLDSLLKLRRAPELVDCSSSVSQDRLSAAGDTLESSATPNETNEVAVDAENVTNEATDVSRSERKVLKRSTIKIKSRSRIRSKDRRPAVDHENTTNEATADREIVTNEATVECEIGANEATLAADVGLESPTYAKAQESTNKATEAREIVTNDPTDPCEGRTNEATEARENATNEATADDENLQDEPTPPGENATNEPMLATPSAGSDVWEMYLARGQERRFTMGGRGSARASTGLEEARQKPRPRETGTGWDDARTELWSQETGTGLEEVRPEPRPPDNGSIPPVRGLTAGMNDGSDSDSREEIRCHKSAEWIRAGLATRWWRYERRSRRN
jgi:hypothetical protein